MKCNNCNKHFVMINKHYSQSICNYPNLTKSQKEIVNGLVLGDGCLVGNNLIVVNTNYVFLKYLKNSIFKNFQTSLNIRKISKFSENKNHKYDQPYTFRMTHPSFKDINIKNIKITPLTLKYWYVCDGSINFKSSLNRRPNITISSYKKSIRNNITFKDTKLNPKLNKNGFFFGTNETVKFFKFIGAQIPGFEYKWTKNIISDKKIQKIVIKTIKKLEKNHSIAEISNTLGVSRQTIRNWKDKKTTPALNKFKKIMDR